MNGMIGTTRLQPGSAQLLSLRTVRDPRGALSVVEQGIDLPFQPKRLYYLHSPAPHTARGVHAHRNLQQLMITMSGVVDIDIDDGTRRQSFRLDNPDQGLLLRPTLWRTIHQHADSVLAVLASDLYDQADYIFDYDEFLAMVRG